MKSKRLTAVCLSTATGKFGKYKAHSSLRAWNRNGNYGSSYDGWLLIGMRLVEADKLLLARVVWNDLNKGSV